MRYFGIFRSIEWTHMRKISMPPQSTTFKDRDVHLSGRPRVLSPTEGSELCGGEGSQVTASRDG